MIMAIGVTKTVPSQWFRAIVASAPNWQARATSTRAA
jgi:hypothetical protein